MSDRVPCRDCGETILPATAALTGGVCMACKQGIRKNIERAKVFYEEQKKPDPERDYWTALVNRIYHTEAGYAGLAPAERTYYLGCVLNGEVYNGGLHQFYSNSAGDRYADTVSALDELRASNSLRILRRSCDLLFPGADAPPSDRARRFEVLPWWPDDPAAPRPTWEVELSQLDKEFWADPDTLGDRLTRYGLDHGLFSPKPTT